jgi:peptidoglycan hydrolase CwlO-like protein
MPDLGEFFSNHDIYKLLRQVRDLAEDTDKKVSAIMAAQDDVNAAAAELVSITNTLGTIGSDLNAAVANIKAEIAALQSANPAVDTTALNAAVAGVAAPLAALQSADAAVDALETPASSTPPAAPPAAS